MAVTIIKKQKKTASRIRVEQRCAERGWKLEKSGGVWKIHRPYSESMVIKCPSLDKAEAVLLAYESATTEAEAVATLHKLKCVYRLRPEYRIDAYCDWLGSEGKIDGFQRIVLLFARLGTCTHEHLLNLWGTSTEKAAIKALKDAEIIVEKDDYVVVNVPDDFPHPFLVR